jgi:hypothetical protein
MDLYAGVLLISRLMTKELQILLREMRKKNITIQKGNGYVQGKSTVLVVHKR